MSKWQPRFPRLEVHFSSILTEQDKIELERISGVRFDKKGKMLIPHHAIDYVVPKFEEMGIRVAHAETADWRSAPKSWEHHAETLRSKEEVHGWVLDGFCTDFQTDLQKQVIGMVRICGINRPGKTLSAILWACLKTSFLLLPVQTSRLEAVRARV